MAARPKTATLLTLTADIVAAYVTRQPMAAIDVPGAIRLVHDALAKLQNGGAHATGPPAVPIADSIRPDHLVCLEDGHRFKTLKRHLRAAYGLTPEQYRQRWGLPANYPMVAPDYARRRSQLARASGLGRRNGRRR